MEEALLGAVGDQVDNRRTKEGNSMPFEWEGKGPPGHPDEGWPPAPPQWAILVLLCALSATLVFEGILAALEWIQ